MTRPLTERSIRLTGAQVRTVLAGTKTQHREVLRPQPPRRDHYGRDIMDWDLSGIYQDDKNAGTNRWWLDVQTDVDDNSHTEFKVPYQPGQRLWVRESIGRRTASFLGSEATNGVEEAFYLADGQDVVNEHCFNLCPWWKAGTLPSIHMPRWASRITLEVTEVRVQRLQDISRDDAMAEGIVQTWGDFMGDPPDWAVASINDHGDASGSHIYDNRTSVRNFRCLWEHIHSPGSWEANPWVTALTFRRVEQTEGGHAA